MATPSPTLTSDYENPPEPLGEFIVHLGMPKTATTMLQTHLFPNHSQIAYQGKHAGGKRLQYRDEIVSRFLQEYFVKPHQTIRPEFLRQARERITALRMTGKTVVVSNEGFSVGGSGKKRRQATLLQDVCGDCKILLTVREPLSFIEALYFEKLKSYQETRQPRKLLRSRLGSPPRYFDIHQWLEASSESATGGVLDNLRVADTLDIYAERFGADRVGIFIYEQLRDQPVRFMEGLARFLGVDAGEAIRLSQNKSANVRWDSATCAVLKSVSGSLWQRWKFRLGRKSIAELARERCGPETPGFGKRPQVDLSPEWRERILQISREQFSRLQTRWNVPLAEYGYPVPESPSRQRRAA